MRKLALFLLLPAIAAAEVLCAFGPNVAAYNASSDGQPTPDAITELRRLNDALEAVCTPRCPQIALLRNSTAPNMMLVATKDQAKVVYAPQFFQTLYDNFGDGAVIGVLAHEFGHALDDLNPGKFGRGGTPEQRADAWAGCALAKTQLTATGLAEALSGVTRYPTPGNSDRSLRVTSLRVGFAQCGGDAAKFATALSKAK